MSNLVLWGHHVPDYEEMFDLTEKDFAGKLLEYGSGPSAFNSELLNKGHQCISLDPLFALDKATLLSKTSLIFADKITQLYENEAKFDFSHVKGIDAFIEQRRAGMTQFFSDYIRGKKEKRYLPLLEISLPFNDFTFDIALSSHYLFSDLENQDLEFHYNVIKELARVAKEVRIFPLFDRNSNPTPFLGPTLLKLQQNNYNTEVKKIAYSFQPKNNALLRVWASECRL